MHCANMRNAEGPLPDRECFGPLSSFEKNIAAFLRIVSVSEGNAILKKKKNAFPRQKYRSKASYGTVARRDGRGMRPEHIR